MIFSIIRRWNSGYQPAVRFEPHNNKRPLPGPRLRMRGSRVSTKILNRILDTNPDTCMGKFQQENSVVALMTIFVCFLVSLHTCLKFRTVRRWRNMPLSRTTFQIDIEYWKITIGRTSDPLMSLSGFDWDQRLSCHADLHVSQTPGWGDSDIFDRRPHTKLTSSQDRTTWNL